MVAKKAMAVAIERVETHTPKSQQVDEVFKLYKCLFIDRW